MGTYTQNLLLLEDISNTVVASLEPITRKLSGLWYNTSPLHRIVPLRSGAVMAIAMFARKVVSLELLEMIASRICCNERFWGFPCIFLNIADVSSQIGFCETGVL